MARKKKDPAFPVGTMLIPKKTRTGRAYVVVELKEDRRRLMPVGNDVKPSRNPESGHWQGGVRPMVKTVEVLRDGWRIV